MKEIPPYWPGAATVNTGHLIHHVRPETFRRVCMSFDAWIVGYGISTLLRQLHVIESGAAFSVLAAVWMLDVWLLYRFFRRRRLDAGAAGRPSDRVSISPRTHRTLVRSTAPAP